MLNNNNNNNNKNTAINNINNNNNTPPKFNYFTKPIIIQNSTVYLLFPAALYAICSPCTRKTNTNTHTKNQTIC